MRRRDVLTLAGAAALATIGRAGAQTSRVYRVGLLSSVAPIANDSEQGTAFLRSMKESGYVLGQNLAVERRGAMGRVDQLPALAQELVAAKVDVLVVNGFPSALAAKATGRPTVVAAGIGDAVATGLVDSLARPGGNVTGISEVASELSTKRLALLKELLPGLRHVAMLWNQDDLGMSLRYQASAGAADTLGVAVQALGVREPDDFNEAFSAMDRDRPDAILMVSDSLTVLNRTRVFEYAAARRLPAVYEAEIFVRDGGLMSYGADTAESFGRAAAFVDQILKGSKPSDLPFERPTRYTFALNLKTARAIGLEVPPLLLARADEVVE
jgi:putative ABC transport system substrate-binding protein